MIVTRLHNKSKINQLYIYKLKQLIMTKQKELQMRLKIQLPMSFWNRVDKVIELNREWAERVVEYNIDKGLDYVRMVDVLHDVNGILQEDEHFVPRV